MPRSGPVGMFVFGFWRDVAALRAEAMNRPGASGDFGDHAHD